METAEAITAQLLSMGITAGRIYTELDENYGEKGKPWATSDAGLFVLTSALNEERQRVIYAKLLPWPDTGSLELTFSAVLAEWLGPYKVVVRLPAADLDVTSNLFVRGGANATERNELVAFALDILAHQRGGTSVAGGLAVTT